MVHDSPPVRLSRGFWVASAIFAILGAIAVYFVYTFDINASMPEAIRTAAQVDKFFRFVFATGFVLIIFVAGYVFYFGFAFRAKKDDPPDAVGVHIHDNPRLEFAWTLLPTIFVVVLSVVSVYIWREINFGPNNGLVVQSIGHQFYFTFRYPQVNGEITDEMHLPVGVPVVLNLTSSDVIHSFWVPAMRIKIDMVPGLVTSMRFTPIRPGRYNIICAQFCGTNHDQMHQQHLVIEDRASYDTWYHRWQVKNANVSNALATVSTGAVSLAGGNASAGQALFNTKCTACHAIGPFSDVKVGPGLRGLLDDPKHPKLVDGDAATPPDIANILQHGYNGSMGSMPNQAANGLSDKDIANLVAYLASLK